MRIRREWTAADDGLLRKFHAEGKNDGDIAYILGRGRPHIQHRRKRLGLAANKRRDIGGWTHGPEARAKMSAKSKQRWQDPAYREKRLEELAKIARSRPSTVPGKRHPDYNRYRKFLTILGREAALAEIRRQP